MDEWDMTQEPRNTDESRINALKRQMERIEPESKRKSLSPNARLYMTSYKLIGAQKRSIAWILATQVELHLWFRVSL